MVSQCRGAVEKRVCGWRKHIVADKGLLIYHRYIRTADNAFDILIGVLKVIACVSAVSSFVACGCLLIEA